MAVLITSADTRQDWLAAGQALQRVLLHAAAHEVIDAKCNQRRRERPCVGRLPEPPPADYR
ncbi:MAG TPA: hypothetical protein VFV66_31975 [Nonomuraea sp.]|nr:hypothetical protein [Nonomuraea sp.]